MLSLPICSNRTAAYGHKTSLAEEKTLSRRIFLRKRRPKDAQKTKNRGDKQILPVGFGSSEPLYCSCPSLSKNTLLNQKKPQQQNKKIFQVQPNSRVETAGIKVSEDRSPAVSHSCLTLKPCLLQQVKFHTARLRTKLLKSNYK